MWSKFDSDEIVSKAFIDDNGVSDTESFIKMMSSQKLSLDYAAFDLE